MQTDKLLTLTVTQAPWWNEILGATICYGTVMLQISVVSHQYAVSIVKSWRAHILSARNLNGDFALLWGYYFRRPVFITVIFVLYGIGWVRDYKKWTSTKQEV